MGESSKSSVSAMDLMEEGENQPKIAPKRRKSQEIVEKGGENRISVLPDCLLVEILSHLPSTKNAITGTLSKRWKYLWTAVHTLIFEYDVHDLRWSDFVSFVDKTLTQHCQLKLNKFDLYTCGAIQWGLHVNDWIHYAIRCNVEDISLKLWNVEDKFSLDESFFINTCFTDLRLECRMLSPNGAISWKNLKSLYIHNADLNEDLIENILSGSPVLEILVLNDCDGYRRLDITSKSIKNLALKDCYGWGRLEIKAPNILSLTIEGVLRSSQVLLVNLSSLVEANLSYIKIPGYETTYHEVEEEILKGLISNLRHVKELKIGSYFSKVLSRLVTKGFVIPSNMRFPDASYHGCSLAMLNNGPKG